MLPWLYGVTHSTTIMYPHMPVKCNWGRYLTCCFVNSFSPMWTTGSSLLPWKLEHLQRWWARRIRRSSRLLSLMEKYWERPPQLSYIRTCRRIPQQPPGLGFICRVTQGPKQDAVFLYQCYKPIPNSRELHTRGKGCRTCIAPAS